MCIIKPIIGITSGDPSGIGPEIAIKALQNTKIYQKCVPIIIGDYSILNNTVSLLKTNSILHEIKDPSDAFSKYGTIDYIDTNSLIDKNAPIGTVSIDSGKAAFSYIIKAIELAKKQQIHAVVTCPINKESIRMAGYNYSGHTEIFAEHTETNNYAMLLMAGSLRVIHVTTHVSIKKACEYITTDNVLRTICLANQALIEINNDRKKIAVAGFNPHCSENGLFGDEENDAIIPAINKARELGIDVIGPLPPDTVFMKTAAGLYDIVVAMYHDQGHIPLKMVGFSADNKTGKLHTVSGINCTIGLPIIRVSVDHGTAFDIAGKGIACEDSLLDAIFTALKMYENKFLKEQK